MGKIPVFRTVGASFERVFGAPVQFWAILMLSSAVFALIPDPGNQLDLTVINARTLSGLGFFIVYNCAAIFFLGAMTTAMLDKARGTRRSIVAALVRGVIVSPPVILLIILVFLAIYAPIAVVGLAAPGGLLLVLLPAVIFGLWLSAVYFVTLPTLVEQRLGFRGIGAASAMTRGNRWRIVGVILIPVLLLIISGLVLLAVVATLVSTIGPDVIWVGLLPTIILGILGNALFVACIVEVYTRLSDDPSDVF
ncbi:MAG: hypothetical protein AAFQ36_04585 [Pseudomonadota bacterium]